ncbi:MAG: hypothetical protein QM532_04190 [Cyanobium sp. MAG06]|nr:hypothetical protein [Cyanobium sp. MAG06]
MRDLSPDYLFIGVADHDSKIINNGIRDIEENSTLSSVQAAKLAVIMNSKNVIPSGIYNHSV